MSRTYDLIVKCLPVMSGVFSTHNRQTLIHTFGCHFSAAEAELQDLKAAHKKALDKAKKENTKLKAKLLAASKGKASDANVEEVASAVEQDTASADDRVTELQAENEKLREELTNLKTRQLTEIRCVQESTRSLSNGT